MRGGEFFDIIYDGPSGNKRYDVWRRGQETFLSVSLRGPAALQKQAPKEREFYIIRSEMFRCPLPFLQLL